MLAGSWVFMLITYLEIITHPQDTESFVVSLVSFISLLFSFRCIQFLRFYSHLKLELSILHNEANSWLGPPSSCTELAALTYGNVSVHSSLPTQPAAGFKHDDKDVVSKPYLGVISTNPQVWPDIWGWTESLFSLELYNPEVPWRIS